MTTTEFHVKTQRRTQLVSITTDIAGVIANNNWLDGVVTVFVPHTTAGITINENADPDVARGMESFSDELIPQSQQSPVKDLHVMAARLVC